MDLDQLFASTEEGAPPTTAFEGKIAKTVDDTSDELFVTIPEFDTRHKFGPCPWSPRINDAGSEEYPAKGDRCLVIFSNDETPWVIGWTPYG